MLSAHSVPTLPPCLPSPTFPWNDGTYTYNSEYLRLPKSTLQTQVAHGAKSDLESDFNFETEYLLDCSIPNKPPGEAIFLQECLADYFTNIVQVRRQLVTPADERPPLNYSTKPFYTPSSWSSGAGAGAGGDELPPYMGDGNGFYGDEKKKKSFSQVQERNVAAWQVSLRPFPSIPFPFLLPSTFLFLILLMYFYLYAIVLQTPPVLCPHLHRLLHGSPPRKRKAHPRNLSQTLRLRQNPQTALP